MKVEENKHFYDIISCHDARRTFVTCSLALGMTPEAIMKATGHHDYETMKPYIETTIETQAREMEKWETHQFKSQINNLLDNASERFLKDVLADIQKRLATNS